MSRKREDLSPRELAMISVEFVEGSNQTLTTIAKKFDVGIDVVLRLAVEHIIMRGEWRKGDGGGVEKS